MLMASVEDVKAFFDDNAICGKTIQDLRPFAFDYMIQNLDEIEDIEQKQTESAITTDRQICILFTDGSHMEIEFPGNGPMILGYNTADFSKYPQYDGSCYTLTTMFRHCIGKKIIGISVIRSNEKMLFPCYKGIDMSEDDDGIKEIRLALDDNSYLSAAGVVDFFNFSHYLTQAKCATVSFKDLLNELQGQEKIMDNKVTDRQKELLTALVRCGISMNALIAVGVVIHTDAQIAEMSRRITAEVDNGKKLTDGVVGQIMTDMMTEGLA